MRKANVLIRRSIENKRQYCTMMYKLDFTEIFPTEIISFILSYLDIESLLQASLVNKKWRNIIVSLDLLWKRKCLTLDRLCVDRDKANGFSWKHIAIMNSGRNGVKRRWLQGRYSCIKSSQEIPRNILCKLDVETWGRILDAECNRTH